MRWCISHLSWLLAIVVQQVFAATSAFACATCGFGENDPTKSTYLLTTVILSAVPLIAMGVLYLWLKAKLSKIDEDQAADVHAPQ